MYGYAEKYFDLAAKVHELIVQVLGVLLCRYELCFFLSRLYSVLLILMIHLRTMSPQRGKRMRQLLYKLHNNGHKPMQRHRSRNDRQKFNTYSK